MFLLFSLAWLFGLQEAVPSIPVTILFQKAGISLLIGALVGLEREHAAGTEREVFAGIRTFPLIGLLGCLAGLLAETVSEWIMVACFAGFGALAVVSYFDSVRRRDHGATTEISALLVFLLGLLTYYEFYALAIATGVVTTLFLSVKAPLHSWVQRLSREDIYATVKFALITAIVLPILPNRTMGPFNVLNPREVWYMVILIAGLSFLGYVLVKVFGSRRGVTLTGVLGGLMSSTAVTLSLSQKSHEASPLGRTFGAAILVASSIMYPRVIIEVAIVNPSLVWPLVPFVAILTVVGLALGFVLGRKSLHESSQEFEFNNPFRLASAVQLGILFAVILVLSKVANTYYGDQGLLVAAALSGLADVDAMTLSAANLAKTTISDATANAAIMIAAVSNTLTKALIAAFIGTPALRRYTIPSFGALIAVGIGCILWLTL